MPKCKVVIRENNDVDTTAYLIKCNTKYYGVLIIDDPYYAKNSKYAYSVFNLRGTTESDAWVHLRAYWDGTLYQTTPMPKKIDRDDDKAAIAVLLYYMTKQKK